MLLALAAAGATVALTLGIVGAPLLEDCATDPRGVVTCLRDMADRRFNLPGEPRGKAAEAAPDLVQGIAPPATVVVAEVPDAELTRAATPTESEAQDSVEASPSPLQGGDRGGGPQPPAAQPERTAYVKAAPPAPQPVAPLAPVQATPSAQAEGQGGPLVPAIPPAEATASVTADLPPQAASTATPTPSAETRREPVSVAEEVEPAERQASVPPVIAPPLDAATEPVALESEPPGEQTASAPPVSDLPTADPPVDDPTSPTPLTVGPPGKQPGSVPPAATVRPEAPLSAVPEPEPPPTTTASIEPVEPSPEPSTAAPIALAPTIDAIELEGDASYVSGSGPAGALIRLYADGKLVGESQVEEGRWIVEAGALLTKPRRELRIEAIEPETGKLLGEAVITVEIEPPKTPPAEPAPDPPPQTQGETAAPPRLAASPPGEPVGAADSQPVASSAEVPPASSLGEPLPELLPVVPRGETESVTILPPPGYESAVTRRMPAAPALIADFDASPKPRGKPIALVRLLPFGDPVNGRFTGGRAIIRPGDTLWSIAHRHYGSGKHYRTIFKANRDLLRRPSRIFPGQVLELPLVTEE